MRSKLICKSVSCEVEIYWGRWWISLSNRYQSNLKGKLMNKTLIRFVKLKK